MMRSAMATKVRSIRHALATYDRILRGMDASRLNEDFTFQAAESMEKKADHNSFSYSKNKRGSQADGKNCESMVGQIPLGLADILVCFATGLSCIIVDCYLLGIFFFPIFCRESSPQKVIYALASTQECMDFSVNGMKIMRHIPSGVQVEIRAVRIL